MIDFNISDGICILRLNNPPANAINFRLLEELTASVDRANSDEAARAIVIIGSDDHFSAGADVAIFEELKTPEEAKETSRRFQMAFDLVENSRKPTVAALAGTVMGGAVELAMACRFRVSVSNARFGMSEVKLGINPGAGGTQRLPRLVGVGPALEMLLTGRPKSADDALRLGLVDGLSEKGRLVETCRRFLVSPPQRERASRRSDKVSDASGIEKDFAVAHKLVRSIRPEIIAPLQIIDAVRTGLLGSYETGLLKEREAFARCMETLAARNLISLFFATRRTGKVPELDAVPSKGINRVAVIGMGTMGSGIAQAFAAAGKSVIATDLEPNKAVKGIEGIKASLDRKVGRGALTSKQAHDIQSRITAAAGIHEIWPADLVIEAVFENLEIKQSIIANVEAICSSGAIIASNTSTIDLDALAGKLRHAGRLVGLHFFNPAHSMPLVEVVECVTTSRDTCASAMRCMKELRKTPILVKNSVGFAVNRVFIPYFMEAFQLLEEGAEAHEIDAAMIEFGFPMGPLSTMDMTGLDILALSDRQMQAAFPYHLPLPRIVRELVEQGLLGQKTGSGVYKYEKGDSAAKPSDRFQTLLKRLRGQAASPMRAFAPKDIADRLVMRLVCEAFRVVEEGIVVRESDLDVASVLGAGFPDFRGGVLSYAYHYGITTIKSGLDALADQFGARFRPCHYLLKKTGA
jgi:3-hydroxyacyl-CoA dehydrogenase/enoyl-CoA hydratase/carnithine racemase